MVAIQYLPIEIQEKIYKYYVADKLVEKEYQGWKKLHELIKSAPYCELRERIVNITFAENVTTAGEIICATHVL